MALETMVISNVRFRSSCVLGADFCWKYVKASSTATLFFPRQEQASCLAGTCARNFSPARFEVPIPGITIPAMRLSLTATGIALTVDHASRRAKSSGLFFKGGRALERARAGLYQTMGNPALAAQTA